MSNHYKWLVGMACIVPVLFMITISWGDATQNIAIINNDIRTANSSKSTQLINHSGKNFYVTPDKKASLGNGTREKPFNAIAAALNAANPGDTVRLLPGVYYGFVEFPKGGLPGKPITLTTDGPTRSAIIDGQDANVNGIQVDYPYVVIDGLEVRNVKYSGLKSDGDRHGTYDGSEYGNLGEYGERHNRTNGADGVIFKNNYIHNIGYDGIKVGHANNLQLLNNEVYKTGTNGQQQGIDLVGVYGAVIKGNYVYDDTQKPGMAVGIFAKGGSENILIENNVVENIMSPNAAIEVGGDTEWYNTRYSPGLLPRFNERVLKQNYSNNEIDRSGKYKDSQTYSAKLLAEARNVVVRGNLIISSDPPLSFRNAYNVKVYNNTMINTGWTQGWVKLWSDQNDYHVCEDVKLYNNIFYNAAIPLRNGGNVKKGYIYVDKNDGPNNRKGFISDYNLYYNMGNKPFPGIKGSDVDRHSIVGDPLLDSNFNLKNESPAIGAGADLVAMGLLDPNDVFVDRNGTVVFHGKRFDVGAFAYQSDKYGLAVMSNKPSKMMDGFDIIFSKKELVGIMFLLSLSSFFWCKFIRSKRTKFSQKTS